MPLPCREVVLSAQHQKPLLTFPFIGGTYLFTLDMSQWEMLNGNSSFNGELTMIITSWEAH